MAGNMEFEEVSNIARALCVVIFVCLFTACGDQATECPLTLDQTSIIDQKEVDGTTYYLVERISGWHEKTIIIQLFDKKPEFDKCNENIITPIIDDSVSTDLEVKTFLIDLKSKEYVIEYGGDSETEIQTSKFKVIFK